MNNTYILNRETEKIELHFEKAEYDALTDTQRSALKSAFLWSRSAKAWVSRAKYPNLFNAKRVAKSLGFTEEERVGEHLSYAEQLERRTERAEARAERYEQYAANAETRGDNLTAELDSHRGDTAFFTQPIIPGHAGSESFARRRQRIYDRYDKGMREYRKSEYFKERAETALETASNAQLQSPTYLNNRIKECNANIRKLQKTINRYVEIIEAIENPTEENEAIRKTYSGHTLDEYIAWRDDYMERLEIQIDKLAFFENAMDEIGGLQFNQQNIKRGYIVEIHNLGQYRITKANPTTVYASAVDRQGSIVSFTYADILKVVSAVEDTGKNDEQHPFKEGDILIWDPHRNGAGLGAYQVTGITAKTVLIRQIKRDEQRVPIKDDFVPNVKVMRKKPFLSLYSKEWEVAGDGQRMLTLYKPKEGDEQK